MSENLTSRAALVGIASEKCELEACNLSLDELERLLNTAGGEAFCRVIQIKSSYDPRTCIGSGKIKELAEICKVNAIDLVVFDFELSPSQIRNIEDDIGVEVIDRTMLILDIFALHAVSGEGKLQVELAQLKYTAPRLIGRGTELSRQEGRIGTRGPGESKLESDRRYIKRRIVSIEEQIREMEKNRATMRAARDRSGLPKIAIVGYTNAGKSSLLNYLTNAGVLAEDKLFATLDPTTRRLVLPSGEAVLLTDTVGLIKNLPHQLIKAFKSTLDEALYADVLMIVVDVSDSEYENQLTVTKELLRELNVSDKPVIYVYNKCDVCDILPRCVEENTVYISAKNGDGVDELLAEIQRIISNRRKTVIIHLPYGQSAKLNALYNDAVVENVEYTDEFIEVRVTIENVKIAPYESFIIGDK